MTRLRASRSLVRVVAVWCALFVALGSVAPWMQARAGDTVCSATAGAGSAPTRDVGHDDGRATRHPIECPLCLPLFTPPAPHVALSSAPARFVEQASSRPVPAPVASATAAPLPARGPPSIV